MYKKVKSTVLTLLSASKPLDSFRLNITETSGLALGSSVLEEMEETRHSTIWLGQRYNQVI